MKINEIAVLTESQELEEAPIGILKRMGTAIKGMFSASQAQESKVQSAVNALYKEYKTYWTATPAQRPTGQNMLEFLKGTGYLPNKDFKTVTDVANAAEEAEKIKNAKTQQAEPEAEPEQSNTNDKENILDFNKEKNKSPDQNYRDNYDQIFKQGMYEAVDIKADTPLEDDTVKKIIEFIVRHSYATDYVKDLNPGAFTNKSRLAKQKQQQEKEFGELGYKYDPVKKAWVPIESTATSKADSVAEGFMNFDPGDGNIIKVDIKGNTPTPAEIKAAKEKFGVKKDTGKTGLPGNSSDDDDDEEKAGNIGHFAAGFRKGQKIGSNPLGALADKIKDKANMADAEADGTDVKQAMQKFRSTTGIKNPQVAADALRSAANGEVITPQQRKELAPFLAKLAQSMNDPSGQQRIAQMFRQTK